MPKKTKKPKVHSLKKASVSPLSGKLKELAQGLIEAADAMDLVLDLAAMPQDQYDDVISAVKVFRSAQTAKTPVKIDIERMNTNAARE